MFRCPGCKCDIPIPDSAWSWQCAVLACGATNGKGTKRCSACGAGKPQTPRPTVQCPQCAAAVAVPKSNFVASFHEVLPASKSKRGPGVQEALPATAAAASPPVTTAPPSHPDMVSSPYQHSAGGLPPSYSYEYRSEGQPAAHASAPPLAIGTDDDWLMLAQPGAGSYGSGQAQ